MYKMRCARYIHTQWCQYVHVYTVMSVSHILTSLCIHSDALHTQWCHYVLATVMSICTCIHSDVSITHIDITVSGYARIHVDALHTQWCHYVLDTVTSLCMQIHTVCVQGVKHLVTPYISMYEILCIYVQDIIYLVHSHVTVSDM